MSSPTKIPISGISILRKLASFGYVGVSTWRTWDQRILRTLFLKKLISLARHMPDAGECLEITRAGWQILNLCNAIPLRKDPESPTFIEANDSKRARPLNRTPRRVGKYR